MSSWSYIVLVGALVLVFALLAPRKKQVVTDSNQAVRNMEIALEQFMENMELDNQELVKLVTLLKEEGRTQTDMNEQRIIELERKLNQMEHQLEQQRMVSSATAIEGNTARNRPVATVVVEALLEESVSQSQTANTIATRYMDLLKLYSEGKSIEAIAKKMNMNKGEVQLILQLAKQEEGVRA